MIFLKILKNNLKITLINFNKLGHDKNFLGNLNLALKQLTNCIKNNGKIIFAGNGGSAADAQHLAAELVGKFLKKRRSIPAISLTTNTSIITSLANDFNYNYIFARQIESLANKGDIFFGITTSGKSKNLIEAFKTCKKMGIGTICLTKKKYPRNLDKLCDIVIPVTAERVDRIQEIHIFVGHTICENLENAMKFKTKADT
jgi:D-sedoheptulose 7-phosphate isomerase